jgi:hypothetical protein
MLEPLFEETDLRYINGKRRSVTELEAAEERGLLESLEYSGDCMHSIVMN